MTFNIGSQSGGIINNVAGDQRVKGGQQATQVSREGAASSAAALGEVLAAIDLSALTERERVSVQEEAALIDAEMAAKQPSPQEAVPTSSVSHPCYPWPGHQDS